MILKPTTRGSPNWNARRDGRGPDMVILHYTGMRSAAAAIERLCDPSSKVSSHYLIDSEGQILSMVPEELRAWHAGASSWHGDTDINSRSIGIELVNPGHAHGPTGYSMRQMSALLRLLEDIQPRHAIRPGNVLGHSDVAPERKQDPGEWFDWVALHRRGFGLWVPAPPAVNDAALVLGVTTPEVLELQRDLSALGYGLERSGIFDRKTELVVTAFQRHWRPARVDGRADSSTLETLAALLKLRRDMPTA